MIELLIGEGEPPNPQKVLRLLHNDASGLFRVIVTLSSGKGGPSVTQQQDICLAQMQEFLAFNGVSDVTPRLKHLELIVRCIDAISGESVEDPTFTLTAAAGVVVSELASSVPSLQQMTLEGSHSAAYLVRFGSLCPHLYHLLLHMGANHLSIPALSEIGKALPNISKVTFKRDGPLPEINHGQHGRPFFCKYTDRNKEGLSTYMDSALEALSTFSKLTTLSLDFDPETHLEFDRDSWSSLPPGLVELTLNCRVTPFNPNLSSNQLSVRRKEAKVSHGLMYDGDDGLPDIRLYLHHGLQRLTMICPPMSQDTVVLPFQHLTTMNDILVARPNLLKLTLTGHETPCLHCNSSVAPSLASVLPDFDLVCSTMVVVGDLDRVEAVLDLLPSLKNVQHCSFSITGNINISFLQRVARVFPGLAILTLISNSRMGSTPPSPSVSSSGVPPPQNGSSSGTAPSSSDLDPPTEALFQPLEACTSIRRVILEMHQNVSTSSLLALCLSLPCLTELQIGPVIVVDAPNIEAQLKKKGRHIVFRSFIDKLHRKGLLQKWTIVA